MAEHREQRADRIDEEQLLTLVRLFEEFNRASSAISESYQALEQRLAELSERLESQEQML